MAKTESTMLALGTPAPNFTLPDTVSGNQLSLDDCSSDTATVIMFICNHCPFVVHVNQQLVALAEDYISRGVKFVAISANDINNYPQDAPEKMTQLAKDLSYPFPYLYDESQAVARAYHAACTPDFFIFDKSMKLAYRGQLDDSRPGNEIPVSGKDIREALDALIAGNQPSTVQKPSIGCNIKWK